MKIHSIILGVGLLFAIIAFNLGGTVKLNEHVPNEVGIVSNTMFLPERIGSDIVLEQSHEEN